MDGYLTTQLLRVAARLGVADALSRGPCSGAVLAGTVGADASRLTRVLRGLVLAGVLAEDDAGSFSLTPAGELLRAEVPGSMRELAMLRGEVNYRAAEGLLDAVLGGPTPFEAVYGQPFFDYLASNADHGTLFSTAMADRAAHEARQVVEAYDFAGVGTVVDVGAGEGVLLREILQATAGTRGVLVDTPAVVAQARKAFDGTDLQERVDFVAADFFDTLPSGGDAYVLSRVLHDWDDPDAARILASCRAAAGRQSRLLVVEALQPQRVGDRPAAVRMDVAMLVLLGGRERREEEYRALLDGAGFEVRRVLPTRSPLGVSVIEAVARPGR